MLSYSKEIVFIRDNLWSPDKSVYQAKFDLKQLYGNRALVKFLRNPVGCLFISDPNNFQKAFLNLVSLWNPYRSVFQRLLNYLLMRSKTRWELDHWCPCGWPVWQYRLWSFQTGGMKLESFLPKNQHPQRKLLNFENWISGGLRSFQKSEF